MTDEIKSLSFKELIPLLANVVSELNEAGENRAAADQMLADAVACSKSADTYVDQLSRKLQQIMERLNVTAPKSKPTVAAKPKRQRASRAKVSSVEGTLKGITPAFRGLEHAYDKEETCEGGC